MNRKPAILNCTAITLGLLLVVPVVNSQTRPTAKSLLNQMAKTYARLTSYQDEGVVINTYDEVSGGRIEKLPFKTSFKRPNLFRFEWTDYLYSKVGKEQVVWSNGKDAFTYWEPDKYEKEDDLGSAIAGASGISRGSAHTVPRLLLGDEVGGFSLPELSGTSLLGEEVFEGVRCYHIKGTHPLGDIYELWIGKNDLMLRKVKEETKESGRTTIKEEIRRNIRINEPIAMALFEYKPPIELTPPQDQKSIEDLSKILDAAPAWAEFKSEEGRFSISMPAKPQTQIATLETAKGRYEHHIFIAMAGSFVCFVDYADMPKEVGNAKNAETLFDLVRDEFLKQAQAQFVSETAVTIAGHPGREVKMRMYSGEARLRVLLVNGRLYQLALTTFEKTASHEETFEKFFKSFEIVVPPKTVALVH